MVHIDYKVVVGWALFLYAYVILWNLAIGNMIDQFAIISRDWGGPTQRMTLFMVGLHSAFRVTLLLTLCFLLLYFVMAIMQCIIPFLPHMVWLHSSLTWLFAEDVLFPAVKADLLPFHLAILVATLLITTAYSAIYPTDRALRDPDTSMSIVVRLGMCMSSVAVCSYCALAFFIISG